LAKIVQNPELYTDRCRELTSTIKLCEYNCGGEIPASVGQLSLQDDALDIDVGPFFIHC
jgi:hypothetical protein